MFLSFDWIYNGSNVADYLPYGMSIGDGVTFNMKGDDTFRMGGGDDTIFAGDGEDFIDGYGRLRRRCGADNMSGGAGDDIYVVDNAGDIVDEQHW